MIRQIWLASLLLLSLPAYSTTPSKPNPQSASEGGVRVLYRYPLARYKSLGIHDFDYNYPPGFREPSITDALPSLKKKTLSAGGNALIVRDHRMCPVNRCLRISTEVLRVDWSPSGRVQP